MKNFSVYTLYKTCKKMNKNNKTICVTGASGFVGQNFRAYNTTPYNIFCWDRKNPENFGNADYIVHCAGIAHRMGKMKPHETQQYYDVNAALTLSIAQYAVKQKIKKFIYLSSLFAYGNTDTVINENTPPFPQDVYGKSKLLAEKKLQHFFHNKKYTSCIILQPPLIYGPNNKGNMKLLMQCAKKKIPLPLATVQKKRSLIYVGNLIDAILTVIEKDTSAYNTYLLSDGQDLTTKELYNIFFQTLHNRTGTFYFPLTLLKVIAKIGDGVEKIAPLPINSGTIEKIFGELRIVSHKFHDHFHWIPPYKVKHALAHSIQYSQF